MGNANNNMNSTRSIVAATRIAARPTKNISRSWHSSTPRQPATAQNGRIQNASRLFHAQTPKKNSAAGLAEASNPAMAFPCLDALESKTIYRALNWETISRSKVAGCAKQAVLTVVRTGLHLGSPDIAERES